jgi:hypothetical protein
VSFLYDEDLSLLSSQFEDYRPAGKRQRGKERESAFDKRKERKKGQAPERREEKKGESTEEKR